MVAVAPVLFESEHMEPTRPLLFAIQSDSMQTQLHLELQSRYLHRPLVQFFSWRLDRRFGRDDVRGRGSTVNPMHPRRPRKGHTGYGRRNLGAGQLWDVDSIRGVDRGGLVEVVAVGVFGLFGGLFFGLSQSLLFFFPF